MIACWWNKHCSKCIYWLILLTSEMFKWICIFYNQKQQYLSIYLKENVSCTLLFAGYFFWRAETYTSLFRWQTWRSDNHVYLTISMYRPLDHFMWFTHSSWSYVKTKAALQVALKSYAWTTQGFLPNHTCDCPSFIFVISIWEMVGVCVYVCVPAVVLSLWEVHYLYIVCALSRTISTFSRLWVSKDWFLNYPFPKGLVGLHHWEFQMENYFLAHTWKPAKEGEAVV